MGLAWGNLIKDFFRIDLTDILVCFIFTSLFLMVVPILTFASFSLDLITKEAVMNKNDTGLTLLDRNGVPFFNFYEAKNKTFVPLSQIPKSAQEAAIASEDKDFDSHPGFSVKSILRSLYIDINQRDLAYGGSTLTQQLVKNTLLNPQKNLMRKYQEVILAHEIEQRYSKAEVLEMYLNSVYFGEGAFGIEEASQTFFGKPAVQLDLAESAFLIGLLPAPSKLSPFTGDPEEGKVRQVIVLQKMVEQKYITLEQKSQAEAEKLTFQHPTKPFNSQGFHFAMLVRDQLVQKYGEEIVSRSGFKVRTTLDLSWQDFTEKTVKEQVRNLGPNGVTNGAAVVMDSKTGEVKALVGSIDFRNSKFGQVDVATSPRQPGSSFKPIYYSAALEKGIITPATILQDTPRTFGINYRPKDYDGRFRGPVTARRALSNSLNIPSVEVMSKLGVPEALDQAQKYGLTTLQDPNQYGLSLALGAGEVKLLEMTGAYAIFANQGQKNDNATILQIKDKQDQVVYSYQPQPQPVLSLGAAFLISSILSDNQARREIFGNTLDMSRPAAVKTGTTENYRDAWTLGYTPSLTVGVWVGNNDGKPMDNIAGSLGAAPIWRILMEKFLAGTPVEKFTPPSNEIIMYNCRVQYGKEATQSATLNEYFLKGSSPGYCSPVKSNPTPGISPTISPTPSVFLLTEGVFFAMMKVPKSGKGR
ncbi:MAG: PBP1A family penicillin-binding protein [bacterium]|nr:PBP1A family penicillin-binding protein [bacterium]